MNHVVTPIGAVSVPKKLYDEIVKTRASARIKDMILYAISVPDKMGFTLDGSLPAVTTLEEFIEKYIPKDISKCPNCGHPRRNLLL